MKVLVTAASRHGATAEIVAAIADTLAEAGVEVDRREPATVTSVADYDGVVVGSAVYAGRWLPAAQALLDRVHDELLGRPVWVFSSGPLGDPPEPLGPPPGPEEAIGSIAARDHRVFAGAVERTDLSLAERAIMRVVKAPYGDFRDWAAVRTWALAIADALHRPGMHPTSGTASGTG